VDAQGLLARYCFLLYRRYQVARRAKLDYRTIKKHLGTGKQEGA